MELLEERRHFINNDYERRQLLVEIDVLVAMGLGITLDDLKTIYKLQFPVMNQYEANTWYDKKGKTAFTSNRGQSGVGFEKREWEQIKSAGGGIYTLSLDNNSMERNGVQKIIEYVAPFDRCDREKDYEEVWHNFEERFKRC